MVTRLLFLFCLTLLPASAYAQSALAGVVRDTSGAVLPGVTIEASSPALIEKVRSAVTDGGGQYRIPDLTPGVYKVAFTLGGFATVSREGVELAGGGVTTINADMRIGQVSETITVVGETPVVDVQTSTKRGVVLPQAVISAIPASRGYGNLLATVPGISGTGLDVSSNVSTNFFTARGGRGNEGTIQIDGMNVGSSFNGGGVAGFGYPTSEASEIQMTIAGGLGEVDRGGPSFNMIPKTGGNKFSGTGFLSTAGKWSQGNNLDDTLRSYGITEVPGLIKNWDTNFALGGPIVRDRLWFYNNVRSYGQHSDIPLLYANKNAGIANEWFYTPDTSVKSRGATDKMIEAIRLTSQLTPKNKVGFYYDYQKNCTGSALIKGGEQCRDRSDDWVALGSIGGFGSVSPESGNVWDDREKIVQASWSSPATSKLLLEAGLSSFNSRWGGQVPAGALTGFIPVTELSPAAGVPIGNFTYRGWNSAPSNDQQHNVWRASATYVTGAHSLKVGYQAAYQIVHTFQNADSTVNYTFNARVPSSFGLRIAPTANSNRTRYDGIYVQDQWTRNRLTLQGGVRYEHAWSWAPAGENGVIASSRFLATPFTFPRTEGVKGYHDITPRMGLAYDVFGNGRTSVKANFSKYLQPANNEANFTIANPAGTYQATTTRTWTDANGNFIPDCGPGGLANNASVDLQSSGGDFCGPYSNSAFGNPLVLTTVNPDVLHGWGVRPYDWQFGVSLQQQILPRVSLDVAFSRRSWGNFFATDNRALGPLDYNSVRITAPVNPLLPGGGGYAVPFMVRNARSALGATDNYYTFASDYGDVTSYWRGVDVTVNARLAGGLTLQGGTTTGAGVRDNCQVIAALPELLSVAGVMQQTTSCAVNEPFLTTARGLVAYTIPKIDVAISSSFRSQANIQPDAGGVAVATNGASLNANTNVPAANVPGGLAFGSPFQSVNLVLPGQIYGKRINGVDLRFGKNLRFGRTKTLVALDLYNLTNFNTGTAYQQGYDFATNGLVWLRPTTILNPRFVRFNVTVDF
ncbi:MAG: carboxypeptidase regulatory-like domain-containing protein [Acidobacteriota bacterium]